MAPEQLTAQLAGCTVFIAGSGDRHGNRAWVVLMKPMYIPFDTTFDAETRTWCAQGMDSHGELFGVGAGGSEQSAVAALRDYVLESLLGAANDGADFLGDFHDRKPAGGHLVLTIQELLPVVLRLQRVRQHVRQADMAQRLGMTQQAYAKLERPGANPTLNTLVRLEEALGISLLTLA
jgi:DNA-binding XRE family transcriptional regulator